MSTATGFLNRYLEGGSWFHRADARVKLVMTLGFIFAVATLPPGKWAAFGAMQVLVWLAAGVSRVGLPRVLLRSLVALPFILIALPSMFTRPGVPLFDLNLIFFIATATLEGLEFFVSVLLKSWTSVTAACILTATTPPMRLLEALRALRLPAILVSIVMLMYRYLFVLVEEAQRMMRARAARSAAIGKNSGGTLVWRAKSAGGMAGSLFIRTLDRSERIYLAMLARGYDGSIRRQDAPPVSGREMAALASALSLCAAIAIAARLVI